MHVGVIGNWASGKYSFEEWACETIEAKVVWAYLLRQDSLTMLANVPVTEEQKQALQQPG